MELLDRLFCPGREFTPIPFWFLNGDLTSAELRRQLSDFAAHGVYGVVLHPRMGLAKRIGYLSETYFRYIQAAVRAAEELGMKIVLYDEGMYPSGSACGQVVAGHPELASEGLILTDCPLPADELLAETPAGCLVARKSGGTLRGVHWGEDDGEPNAPASADILNPEAVDRFISLTHEAYYRTLKKWFGNVIIGFFTDEPSILGRNAPAGMMPWTRGFAADFTAAGGSPASLTALFCGQENADTAFYRQMILERESTVYYGKLSAWCENHGIALMGHPHQSDDIEVERYFHIPGQDLVLRWIAPEKSGVDGMDSTMAKCSADAARLSGRRRNANECFGACGKAGNPWLLSGGDIKWYLDWLAVRGVNLFIPHAFYYSIAGKRRDERPPDVGPHSIWWPYYEKWSAYIRRLSFLMTDAGMNTPIAVLCRNRDLRPELVRPLFERQIGFQYLPESVWPECREENGALVCRGRRYAVVLDRTAEHFDDASGRITERFGDVSDSKAAHFGDVSDRVTERLSDALGRITERFGDVSDNKAAHLDNTHGRDTINFASVPHTPDAAMPDCICVPAAPLLRCAHFTRLETECWLLVNEGNAEIQTALTLPADSPIGQYDLWAGKAGRADYVRTESGAQLALCLPVRGSLLLFTCTQAEWNALPPVPPVTLLPLPEFTLAGESPERIEKVYTASVTADAAQLAAGSLALEVEGGEMARLDVNGACAGVSFWTPHRFALDGLLREGENTLRLTFTGSPANRYGSPVEYGLHTVFGTLLSTGTS